MAKIGAGHAAAMGRLGFKELTHNILPAFPQAQHIMEEPGLAGNPTQGEVATMRKGPGEGPEQEAPPLTLAQLKEVAQAKSNENEQQKDRDQQQEQSRELGD
jgi:hypothetical protein